MDADNMGEAAVSAAVSSVFADGYTILRGVVAPEHIAALHARMVEDLAIMQADPERLATQFTTGHVQHDPPPFPPYLYRDILCNEAVIAVTRAVLGAGMRNTFYSGNTNLPGSTTQPVHFDTGHLWREVAHPPVQLVVNIPIVDCTVENGATELWPGSHRVADVGCPGSICLRDAEVAAQREARPPLRAETAVGDVLIRDMRLWHRGMPNQSVAARPMIAMIHTVSWLRSEVQMPFARGAEAILSHPGLTHQAVFVDEPIDYLFRHDDYVE
jgi:hypothetical protein